MSRAARKGYAAIGAAVVALALGGAGCGDDNEGVGEEAGKAIDKGAQEAGKAIDKGANEVGKATDDVDVDVDTDDDKGKKGGKKGGKK